MPIAAAGARAVVHHDLLAKLLGEFRGEDARERIGAATGGRRTM